MKNITINITINMKKIPKTVDEAKHRTQLRYNHLQ